MLLFNNMKNEKEPVRNLSYMKSAYIEVGIILHKFCILIKVSGSQKSKRLKKNEKLYPHL